MVQGQSQTSLVPLNIQNANGSATETNLTRTDSSGDPEIKYVIRTVIKSSCTAPVFCCSLSGTPKSLEVLGGIEADRALFVTKIVHWCQQFFHSARLGSLGESGFVGTLKIQNDIDFAIHAANFVTFSEGKSGSALINVTTRFNSKLAIFE
jgi:hypothetical protein